MRLFPYLLLLFPATGFACSCAWTETFCAYTKSYLSWTEGNTVVARVRLVKFANASRQGYFPLYDFELLEVYAGEAALGDRVSLLGQDGGNCNGVIEHYRIGAEYIVMYPNTPDKYTTYYDDSDVDNPYPIVDLPGCGPSVLTVDGWQVRGAITETITSVPLSTIRDELRECLGELFPQENPNPDRPRATGVSILPNPATTSFTVQPEEATALYGIAFYDMLGRLIWKDELSGEIVTEYRVSVVGLPAGVYVLVMQTDGLRIKEQVIVQ